MQIKSIAVIVLVGLVAFMSAYTVETGNVAVERTLGKVDHEEKEQGLNFKMPFLTNSIEFSAKEIAIDINDLTPKAADNLSLKDLDVSIFYRVPQGRVSDLMVKYAASAARGPDGIYMPANGLLYRKALQRFADNEGSVVVIPANMQGFDLILGSGQLRRGAQ